MKKLVFGIETAKYERFAHSVMIELCEAGAVIATGKIIEASNAGVMVVEWLPECGYALDIATCACEAEGLDFIVEEAA